MTKDPIQWIAGPVAFQASTNLVAVSNAGDLRTVLSAARWEFVGCSERCNLKRWALRFSIERRTFSASAIIVSKWEQAHRWRLFDLYRPVAVRRSDLPARSILGALRAFLTDAEIAEITGIAIRGGRDG
jgi:hypothetical protein